MALLTDDILPKRFVALLTTGRGGCSLATLEKHFDRAEAEPGFIRYRLIGIPGGSQVLNTQFLLACHDAVHLLIRSAISV